MEKLSWGHVKWAHADLRVLIDAPEESSKSPGSPAMSASISVPPPGTGARSISAASAGLRPARIAADKGYASVALGAAIQTMRDHEAFKFALLFCEPHNFAFYQARGWHKFTGEVYAEQPEGRIRFEAMAPFVFDFTRAPRDGTIDLCGLPW